MVEFVNGMKRAFGIVFPNDAELGRALGYVRKRCRCDAKRFRKFVIWYFACYALEPPTSPFRLEDAWVDYCQSGECLPVVLDADRLALSGGGAAGWGGGSEETP